MTLSVSIENFKDGIKETSDKVFDERVYTQISQKYLKVYNVIVDRKINPKKVRIPTSV